MTLRPAAREGLARAAAAALAAAAAAILWAALQPSLAPPGAYGADKLVHLAVFALLYMLIRLCSPWYAAPWPALALLAFGGSIELLQHFVPGRSFSVADWLADAAGVAVGWLTIGAAGRMWRAPAMLMPPAPSEHDASVA